MKCINGVTTGNNKLLLLASGAWMYRQEGDKTLMSGRLKRTGFLGDCLESSHW